MGLGSLILGRSDRLTREGADNDRPHGYFPRREFLDQHRSLSVDLSSVRIQGPEQ